jgi:predicted transcriptional regulator of viral defense system
VIVETLMNRMRAIQVLNQMDKKGRYAFNLYDMSKMFPEDNSKTLQEGLRRLVKSALLVHACRGVYVNHNAKSVDSYVIEHIAKVLRRGEYNYVSLESMLSEYGLISQIPIDRLTIMTTGRSGIYETAYGVIEFTHTSRSADDIRKNIQTIPGRPLRIATRATAVRDLKRVNRNLNLLLQEDVNND